MSHAGAAFVLLAAAVSGPAWGSDARVRSVAYDGEAVYPLHGLVGYQIDIEFEAGESFAGLGAGDIEALSFIGKDNHLFLKPRVAKVATNITILTNRRRYLIDYSAGNRMPEGEASTYALRFQYPALPGVAAQQAAQLDRELKAASSARAQNLDYWYCGDPAVKPVTASDDGVHTRLTFAAQAELPALFVRNDDGSESLLNFSMDAGDVVIHRVARRFIVRRGALTGCIVNQGYRGGGERLETGTIAKGVRRGVQGAVP